MYGDPSKGNKNFINNQEVTLVRNSVALRFRESQSETVAIMSLQEDKTEIKEENLLLLVCHRKNRHQISFWKVYFSRNSSFF